MSDKKLYNKTLKEAMKQLRQDRVSKARERSFISTCNATAHPPSKEERQLKATAKRVSLQMTQLASGRDVQSCCYGAVVLRRG